MFRQDFVGGSYALLDGDQNPLPVRCVLTEIRFIFKFVFSLFEGLLVVSTVQEVGWN